jgi:predicted HicB family RNase H-like nuclease
MKTARLQLRVSEELKRDAERVAKKKKRSLSFLVEQYLEDMVEQDREVTGDEHDVRQI